MAKKPGNQKYLKIASYNINGITSRLAILTRWLKEFEPDIVALQELKAPDERFPQAELAELGYASLWHGQSRWNGVAILSRVGEPVETRRGLPGDPDKTQSRYVEAAVGGVLIGNLYLPNGNPWPGPKFDYKLAWMDRLHAHARSLLDAEVPAMLIGDFNVIPTDLDVYKPERWAKDALFSPQAREKFEALVDQGWTDAVRSLHPEKRIYSFWPYWRQSFERNSGIRIDHALLSPSLGGRLRAAGVDRTPRGWDKTSDHAPLWVEIGA